MVEREAGGRSGVVLLVGAGPGDPDLITVRGARALRRADVVVHDSLASRALLDWAPPHAEHIDVGKRGHDAPTRDQSDINTLLVERARAGQVVVRLKGGDPFVYGRGGEEASACRAAGVAVEVVPGVSSALAAAAAAGIPVTDRRHGASVAIVTGHRDRERPWTSVDWERLAVGADTLVVLMGMRNLEKIVDTLLAHGRAAETPAAVIMEGATPRQRVVEARLAELPGAVRRAGLHAPAVIVVGEVAQLRAELEAADTRVLGGRRVLVTRPSDPEDRLVAALRAAGAAVDHVPLIEIRACAPTPTLDETLRAGPSCDVWFATSRNAIAHVVAHLERLGLAPEDAAPSVLCVGAATAARARAAGFRDVVAPDGVHHAEALARWWIDGGERRGGRALFLRGESARPELPTLLRGAGVDLREAVVYRSAPVSLDDSERAALASAAVLTFASPSAVEAYVATGVGTAEGVVFAAIGARSAEALAAAGLAVQVVAPRPEPRALVDSLERYFEERETR